MNKNEDHDSKSCSRIMQHIEVLTGELEGCCLSMEKLQGVRGDLAVLADYLGVNEVQAILFTSILSQNFKRRNVTVDQLAKFLGCSGITIMKHLPDLKVLQKKRWIRADSDAQNSRAMLNEISFFVVREVFDRLMNEDGELKTVARKDIYEVLSELMSLALDFDKHRITHFEMKQDIRALISGNAEFQFLKTLKGQGLSEEEEMLFMLVCQRTLTGVPDVDLDHSTWLVTGSSHERIKFKRNLVRERSRLITAKLLKLKEGMFRSYDEIMLTDQAIHLFFGEDADLLVKNSINASNLAKAINISEVKLFFNKEEKQAMDRIQKLLTKTGYKGVVRRLKEQHLRTGFTVLFHGSPGTGKTEAVYQLARRSGRGVMKVDLSHTKSMWFGESEKKIKEIFNQYRALSSYSELTPILLFNEADGVFGERRELSDAGASQTFNTMQNILLEELENFEGILIATTNLTCNFDRAFERRFLYKIEFASPDELTRSRIWCSKIKGISAGLADQLASAFDFSGGQIENVTRKYHVNKILYGDDLSYENLSSYCREEQLHRQVFNSIGFRQSDKT